MEGTWKAMVHKQESRQWHPYEPGDIPAPGETLRETLTALTMSQSKLASRAGLTPKHINQIIQGNAPITPETAVALERATGVSSRVWSGLEARYQDHKIRTQEVELLESDKKWLKQMPLAALRKAKCITATGHRPGLQLQEALQFFGVANTEAWKESWQKPAAAFLQSSAFEASAGAVAAWLRLGELAAADIACESFDKSGLRAALPSLRAMTLLDPSAFYPRLVSTCAAVGVCVVVVPEVEGARASGASRFLSPSKALIQLSNRGKRNDKFWFAFFHEVGHLLLHGKKDIFVENNIGYDGGRPEMEAEANHFARELLIPTDYEERLRGVVTVEDARAFAKAIGVAPAIVAGRIQHERQEYTFGARSLFDRYVNVGD